MDVYAVELSYNNKEQTLILPINPDVLEVSEAGNGSTFDIFGLGQVNVIKSRELTEYSFSSILPASNYSFTTKISDQFMKRNSNAYNDMFSTKTKEEDKLKNKAETRQHPPYYYLKTIEDWMKKKRPIRFIFISETYYINTAVSIESFDWKEMGGSGGDIEYTLKLKKYVFYSAKRLEPVKKEVLDTVLGKALGKTVAEKPKGERPKDKVKPKTYKMVSGDTLWGVAIKFLGKGERYREIQKLNNITESEIYRLPIGKVLKLP
ncbi:LysM peptidoglycan-binding domain-containing protein [Paenibacillus yanchengensis]|uniref:LysM peptidoglycan-binding domain-containing protein n=1 Tax=Paenibacillus yanchengensis TaxID=2035833 RepID=A0ABW4YNM1_9BACL